MGRQRVRIITFLTTRCDGIGVRVREKSRSRPTAHGRRAATVSVLASTPSRPDHVVVVILENKDAQDVVGSGSYLGSLAAMGVSLTDMHAETHPSQPNYLALFSGDTPGCH